LLSKGNPDEAVYTTFGFKNQRQRAVELQRNTFMPADSHPENQVQKQSIPARPYIQYMRISISAQYSFLCHRPIDLQHCG
jgi:hypothetical protein